jgi:hypothetical protein
MPGGAGQRLSKESRCKGYARQRGAKAKQGVAWQCIAKAGHGKVWHGEGEALRGSAKAKLGDEGLGKG